MGLRNLQIIFVAAFGTSMLAGCGRHLMVNQDEIINTGMEHRQDANVRTGEPLELNAVCLTDKDLKNDANEELKAGSGITCDRWFSKRPIDGDEKKSKGRFDVPRKQILLLTNNSDTYGTVRGPAVRGSKADGTATVKVGELPSGTVLVHVFAKFVGEDGNVLHVSPATMAGGYGDLWVRVGLDQSRYETPPDFGQFIRVDAEAPKKK